MESSVALAARDTSNPILTTRKRGRKTELVEDGWDNLPHGMGANTNLDKDSNVQDSSSSDGLPSKKRARTATSSDPGISITSDSTVTTIQEILNDDVSLDSSNTPAKSKISKEVEVNARRSARSKNLISSYAENRINLDISNKKLPVKASGKKNEASIKKKDRTKQPKQSQAFSKAKVSKHSVQAAITPKNEDTIEMKAEKVPVLDEENSPGRNDDADEKKNGSVDEKQVEKKRATGDGSKAKRAKKHPYGLTPGESPFPDLIAPTPETCEEVHRLLKTAHDKDDQVKQPKMIPPPSMDVTGCGEVPDLLDALLRTLLSAATTGRNSASSLKGLGDKFGRLTEGLRRNTVNWEAVHAATLDQVIDAIKSGGLAKMKGKNIKAILDAVYAHNKERRDALLKEKETGQPSEVLGASDQTQAQKDAQLTILNQNMLSMDWVFEMTTNEAMDELLKLPGIGVKTASCVILFNMQRPSFAVDTHVWRMCKWLAWVPSKATRDQTFSHCEVRIPDHLKYGLHQLFIRHGKTCPRCRAATGPGSENWETANCVLDHLVTRTGKRKEVIIADKTSKSPVKKSIKSEKAKKVFDETSDSEGEGGDGEGSELSEVPDDEGR